MAGPTRNLQPQIETAQTSGGHFCRPGIQRRVAFEKLGAEPEFLSLVGGKTQVELYEKAESLGADNDLLALIGSAEDTIADADLLQMLRRFNQSGTIWLEKFAEADNGSEG